MNKDLQLEEIHLSLVNGQRNQMVSQIKEYGLYDFWADYSYYLENLYNTEAQHSYFKDATISYFRIENK